MMLWIELLLLTEAALAYRAISLRCFAAREPLIIPVASIMIAIPSLIGRQILRDPPAP
jgi:hypothetical protein